MQRNRKIVITLVGVLSVIAIVATVIVHLSGDRGEFTEASPQTGVSVTGPEKSRTDDPITFTEITEHPPLPVPYELVGKVTGIEGELDGPVTVNLPYPADLPDDQAERLEVMRFDGEQWNALVPERIDTTKKQVSITTTEFSWWGLSTWEAERKAAEVAAYARNILSSGGWWGLDKVGQFAVNPYITECELPALTVQLDATRFVPEAILCAKFDTEDPERRTYRVHISNMRGFPVLVRLPKGVTVARVTPEMSNPYMRMILQVLGGRNGVAVLPGSGELVLRVDSRELPADGGFTITGSLDHVTTILDLSSAIIRTVGTQRWNDRVVNNLIKAQEVIDAAACSMAHGERIAAIRDLTAATLAKEYLAAVTACTSVELIAEIIRRSAGVAYQLTMDDVYQQLRKKLPAKVKAVLTIWQEAFVLTEVVATVLEVKRGGGSYLLTAKVVDPVREDLYRVLPTTGKGGFASDKRTSAANGGSVPYVGTPCLKDQQWPTWQLPSGSASSGYLRAKGDLHLSVVVTYVTPEHRGAVEGTFTQLAAAGAKCYEEVDDSFVELEHFAGKSFGRPIDYRAGRAGWLNSEYLLMGTAAAYDPVKGVVFQVTVSSAEVYADVTPEQVREELVDTMEYLTGRADLMLGTTFHQR